MSEEGLKELRNRIADTDRRIVSLLDERAALSLQIGRIKKDEGWEIYDPCQEENIYRNIEKGMTGTLPTDSLKNIFREIISSSRALQAPLSVAFLGPSTSFSHQAALAHFGKGVSVHPRETIAAVFAAVERGENSMGIVPIENSTEGAVKATLDCLIATPLSIRAEVFLRIRLNLLSGCEKLTGIEKVYSHPQALAQAQGWLRRMLPEARLIETESTAAAARMAQNEAGSAAVGSVLAAAACNLKILAEGIEESPLNTTRFFVVGPRPGRSEEANNEKSKTSILFGTAHLPGALQQALAPFAEAGISLTRIESWPMKERLWEYLFFADFVGHCEEARTKRCLQALKKKSAFLKILGSYPLGGEGRGGQ